MNKLIAFLLVVVCSVGCRKEPKPDCGSSDPVNELSWLRTKINETKANSSCPDGQPCCAQGVWKAAFQNKIVFVFGVSNVNNNGNFACDGIFSVYSCEGDYLGILGSSSVLEVQDMTLIWNSL